MLNPDFLIPIKYGSMGSMKITQMMFVFNQKMHDTNEIYPVGLRLIKVYTDGTTSLQAFGDNTEIHFEDKQLELAQTLDIEDKFTGT